MPRQSKSAQARRTENDERLQGLLNQFSQAVQENQVSESRDNEVTNPSLTAVPVAAVSHSATTEVLANEDRPADEVAGGDPREASPRPEDERPVPLMETSSGEQAVGEGPQDTPLAVLSEVIPSVDGAEEAAVERPVSGPINTLQNIALGAIHIGSINAREISDDDPDLGELVESIRQRGILQPVLVGKTADGYLLIAGERRVRAARLLGLQAIPAVIKTDFDRKEAEDDAVIDMVTENVQRKNFEPWEEAAAYERLMAQGMSIRKVAELIGKTPGYVSVLMKLTRHPAIRAALESRAISTWTLATEMNRLVKGNGQEKWDGAVEEALTFIRTRRPTVPEFRGWVVEQTKRHERVQTVDKPVGRRSGSSFLQREELRWAKMRSEELPRLSRMEISWYREFLKKELQELEQVLQDSGLASESD